MRRFMLACGLVMLSQGAAAATLTPEQVDEKLRRIPVFVLTDAAGAPLVSNDVYGVYLDRSEAVAFRDKLREHRTDVAASVVIRAIPLSEIVRMTGPQATLKPDFIAAKRDRDAAAALRSGTDEPAIAAPLFLVRSGTAYLTVSREGRVIVPVFFTKEQADDVVKRYGMEPGSPPAHVEASPIEVLLTALLTVDDPGIARLSFVPSPAMLAAAATPEP